MTSTPILPWLLRLALPGEVEPEEQDRPREIVVTARAPNRIGQAASASEGTLDGDALLSRPLLRTSELVEAVPGMIAVQHSGGGKAAQYMIRGYNLDHGTDFSIAIDGAPFNLPGHAHGHGYLDLNGFIPETLATLDYRKGPYRAQDGDFSAVAAAAMTTRDRFDAPFASMTGGAYGYRRLATGSSLALGSGSLLIAAELKANDGPWQLAERLRHAAGFVKYSVPTPEGMLRASLSVYDGRWRPTEQIPVRAIGTVLPDRFGTLDPYLRGASNRQVLTIGVDGDGWSLSSHLQHYRFDLLSNFTFFLDDPIRGDELEQGEDRWIWGMRAQRRVDLAPGLAMTMGLASRTDRIDGLGLYGTQAGRRFVTRSLVDARQTSGSAYAEGEWRPSDALLLIGGARIDHYAFRTTAHAGAATSGTASATIVTPKANASLTLTPSLAVYANYGQGFHSNAIRGIIAATDPTPALARTTGYEIGGRWVRGPLSLSATHWWSRSASELLYIGDTGTVEPTGPSRRRGFELVGGWRATDGVTLDAVYATNHARFVGAPGADRIPNALDAAGEAGLTAMLRGVETALRIRYLGPRALTEDNRVRRPATTVVNLRATHRIGRAELTAELLNLFDTARADADYYYASRLPGEPAGGIEDVHSRTVEPRMLRLGATVTL